MQMSSINWPMDRYTGIELKIRNVAASGPSNHHHWPTSGICVEDAAAR